ncbi:MAG: sigma-70 region 4 domain-containing protein, partial [Ruminiclostridium sp.]|nr:sigma-70 region 4 domain-containing protein [Ruminiclostridium sp.]
IAQMLGISEVAVRSRLFRARKALYGILKDGEDDEI